jgi:hypothetical protein
MIWWKIGWSELKGLNKKISSDCLTLNNLIGALLKKFGNSVGYSQEKVNHRCP